MLLGEKLYKKHPFIAEYVQVNDLCVVYRTYNGPIFAVFSVQSVVDAIIESDDPMLITSLVCSRDLRDEKEQEGHRDELFKNLEWFFGDETNDVINGIYASVEYLSSIVIDEEQKRKRASKIERKNTVSIIKWLRMLIEKNS